MKTNRSRRLNDIISQVNQLKVHKKTINTFIENSLAVFNSENEELLECYEILLNTVRKSDSYPFNIKFDIKSDSTITMLDSRGKVVNRISVEEQHNHSYAVTEVHLDGLKYNYISFNDFLYCYTIGKLNKTVFRDFTTCPEYLRANWKILEFRALYASMGNATWLSPIDNFISLDRKLQENNYRNDIIDTITDTMADIGTLGFCPTQYLRRVIIPQFHVNRDNLENFKSSITMFSSSFKYLQEMLGADGDGTASNLFTLKYFIKPFANPSSRIYKNSCYLPGDMEKEEIFYELARQWALLFKKQLPFTKEIIRNLGDIYIASIMVVETPNGIFKELSGLISYIDKISSAITSLGKFRQFLKPLHNSGIKCLKKRFDDNYRNLSLLNILKKHIETTANLFCDKNKLVYIKYINLFSNGAFKSASDIEVVVNLLIDKYINVDENVLNTLRNVSREKRKDLSVFLRECTVFDEKLFNIWYKLPEKDRKDFVQHINSNRDNYLMDPEFITRIDGYEGITSTLETSYICNIVKSSRLDMGATRDIIKHYHLTKRYKLPDVLSTYKSFTIKKKSSEVLKSDEYGNKNYKLLRDKFENLEAIFESIGSEDLIRDSSLHLLECGIEYYKTIKTLYNDTYLKRSELSEEGKEFKRLTNKLNGLEKQLKKPEIFKELTTFLNGLKGGANKVLRELLILYLATDKKYGKEFIKSINHLILSTLLLERIRIIHEPFSSIYSLVETPSHFSIDQINSLKGLYFVESRDYFVDLFQNRIESLPIGLRQRLYSIYKSISSGLSDSNSIIDYFYKTFCKLNSRDGFDKEIKYLESLNDKLYNEKLKKVGIVGGKRNLDLFYGHVGETCISMYYNEIRRKTFIPLRIIDIDDMSLIGYIHLLIANYKGEEVALLAGIEPKSSWAQKIDIMDFYKKLRSILNQLIKESTYKGLYYTTHFTAISNYEPLEDIIDKSLDNKITVTCDKNITFPEGIYNVTNMKSFC